MDHHEQHFGDKQRHLWCRHLLLLLLVIDIMLVPVHLKYPLMNGAVPFETRCL